MRLFPVVILLVLVVASAPVTNARHAGPCWHEYVDALRYGPSGVVTTVKSCINQDAGWLCDILDPCPLP